MGEEREAELWPLSPRGVAVESSSPRLRFRLGKKELVWAEDMAYYVSIMRKERWNLEGLELGRGSSNLEADTCQVATFLLENEYLYIQRLAGFLPLISCYYPEPRTILAYIIRDDAKHSEGLLTRLEYGAGPQRSSASAQYALKSMSEVEDLTSFMFLAGMLGKSSISALSRGVARVLLEDGLGQLLTHIAEDERLHASFAAAHVRHRLKINPQLVGELEEMVEGHELYLLSVMGTDEPNRDSLMALLRREGFANMLAEVDSSRRSFLMEAGLDGSQVERMMRRITSEKTGFC